MSDQSRRSARGFVSRSMHALDRASAAERVVGEEPCIGCGEETAVGSVFFSDRCTVEHADGTRTYLCTLCDARIRASRKGVRLTDEEVRDIVENGSLAAISWAGGGR
jgi:hypothetical protein